ncbi:nitrogenase [Microcoleus sp. FACHB-831]|uniref:Mo-dependent nitrogenase C-terminal domain-containing protein n=1 Tax=Microcoleus sp. FACHB-831 TaxID=2692827 RepID=UPI001687112B|nr:Mo-dependent nitrogenase C-terminal domain-containing protein [Microcoleus sp. FACHB-831]MBD1922928.1 nitrogenase [Microcoleus sp. FACHB-831]
MTKAIQSNYTSEQVAAWLRGLLAIAWADGDFDAEEQNLIAALTTDELAPAINFCSIEPITPKELADALGNDANITENFLRTAVMVAVADGIYSFSEDKLLRQFFQALGHKPKALEALRHTMHHPPESEGGGEKTAQLNREQSSALPHPDVLRPVRVWLDDLNVDDPQVARFLCKMIPAQCPFERDIKLFGHKVVHIPPLCKLNPLYDQLVGLRFRALSYLADDCKEDVSNYY